MKFTDITIIDPIMSILVAIFIFINALKNIKNITDIFLEKVPTNISIEKIRKSILNIEGVIDVHHIHVWSMDGHNNYATMHVVIDDNIKGIKNIIREKLQEYDINHVTIEIESVEEQCNDKNCKVKNIEHHHH